MYGIFEQKTYWCEVNAPVGTRCAWLCFHTESLRATAASSEIRNPELQQTSSEASKK